MSNECKGRSCGGVGFLGAAIAAWIGASAAFGSCGSCDLTDVVGNKVNSRIQKLEDTLSRKIEETRVTYTPPQGAVYTIEGKRFYCSPAEQTK